MDAGLSPQLPPGAGASLGNSLRPYGISVNGINPDWVDTDMARAYNPDGDPEWLTREEVAQGSLVPGGACTQAYDRTVH